MPLLLGQLIYTSFPKVGYRALASAQVPTQIQQAFIQQIVYQHWDCYNPPKTGYRAAYIYQVALEHTLFGWLYNDGLDDLGRSHLPYFICYYLPELLQAVQLENIFTCLHKGPVALLDRHSLPNALGNIVIPDLLSYQPARIGVTIATDVRDRSQLALQHKILLDLFVPVNELEMVTDLNEQIYKQQEADFSAYTSLAGNDRDTKQAKPLSETAPFLSRSTQTTKAALLIGVSDYGSGFKSLPRAQKDVHAMQQILQHPEIGSFDSVETLLNPDPQVMVEAIETVFSDRQSDDLVVLYFCGHGIQDDSGKLYLGTSVTRKTAQEKLIKSSAVLASFVQEIMSECPSLHQVVILDCCFSTTLTASSLDLDDISGEMLHQLSGKGRVILTSSTSTQCGFEPNPLDSVYTRYLVEGLETGAADLDNDGAIAISELHAYTSRKVQTVIPAMQPGIFGVEVARTSVLASSPLDDPQLKYRMEVERCTQDGEISIVSRSILDVLRETLGLLAQEAAAIEAEVLAPYREYQQKLQRYVQECVSVIHYSFAISDETRAHFQHLQRSLGLRDEDVAPLEAEIQKQIKALQPSERVRASSPVAVIPTEELTQVKLSNTTGAVKKASTTAPDVAQLHREVISPPKSSNINSSNSGHSNLIPVDINSRLPLGVGIAMGLAAGIGVLYAYIQLNEIRSLKTEAKYDQCITKTELESWVARTVLYKDAQRFLNECRLEQAKSLAAGEKLSAAIEVAEKIPENSSLYPEAQKLIKEWSEI